MPASDNALRTHPMIGLPSGLDGVRWNESASSPQPATMPRTVAPRAVAASRLSSTSAPAPSAITKPSRFFENGRTAACGAGLAAGDGFAAELDRGGAGGTGRRQRNRRALGAERLGKVIGHRA